VFSGDGQIFKLHTDVLNKHKYFGNLLSTQKVEGFTKVVYLPENARILKPLLYYIYNGEMCFLDTEIICDLFLTSIKYDLTALACIVASKLAKSLSPENACKYLVVLKNGASNYIVNSVTNFIIQ
jgi:hypothetical protein